MFGITSVASCYFNYIDYGRVFYNTQIYICSMDELKLGSKALSEVFEFDLPKMQTKKPEHVTPADADVCDRCGRNLYASE